MRALCFSTRLAGTDGVSLEAAKVAAVLERLGFETSNCAGELDPDQPPENLVPGMHFDDPVARTLGERAFGSAGPDAGLLADIEERADWLRDRLTPVVDRIRPDLLVMQNVWAIPMHLALARALADLVAQSGLPCLSHEHDYHWERDRFRRCRVPAFLDAYFPFHADNVRHLCINSLARQDLRARRGLDAAVIPNVFDFSASAPGLDDYNRDFRDAIGLGPGDRLILQPTRVVPRKGIELAIDLLAALADDRNVLVITHQAGDEGLGYLRSLEKRAQRQHVDLRYVADRVDGRRCEKDGVKVYSLWDSYPHADFVTYPSLYEGFGNALIETVYFRKPALVNRYSVYRSDIGPRGFEFVEIDGRITSQAVEATARLLSDEPERSRVAEHNFLLGKRFFSYSALEDRLRPELRALGFRG